MRCPFKWECWCWLRNTGAGSLLISALVNFTLFPLHFPCPGGGSARLFGRRRRHRHQHCSGRVGAPQRRSGRGSETGDRVPGPHAHLAAVGAPPAKERGRPERSATRGPPRSQPSRPRAGLPSRAGRPGRGGGWGWVPRPLPSHRSARFA